MFGGDRAGWKVEQLDGRDGVGVCGKGMVHRMDEAMGRGI